MWIGVLIYLSMHNHVNSPLLHKFSKWLRIETVQHEVCQWAFCWSTTSETGPMDNTLLPKPKKKEKRKRYYIMRWFTEWTPSICKKQNQEKMGIIRVLTITWMNGFTTVPQYQWPSGKSKISSEKTQHSHAHTKNRILEISWGGWGLFKLFLWKYFHTLVFVKGKRKIKIYCMLCLVSS